MSHFRPLPPFGSAERPLTATESVEQFIDIRLVELLERYAEKANEGTNGFILRLRVQVIPKELRMQLAERGFALPEDEQAMKVLKIYRHGEGRHEAEMQSRAFEIVESVPNPEAYARVPKVYYTRTLPLSASTRSILATHDVAVRSDHAEVIGMEYVEGEDLAMGLYREALRRNVAEVGEHFAGIPTSVESLTLAELQQHVTRLLDFRAPGGKGRTPAEREFEKRKLAVENTGKLVTYLRSRGFVMDSRIVAQIKNTLNLLHQNGLVHRDAHHRNFMVKGSLAHSKDPSLTPQAYVIDFGTATTFTGEYEQRRHELYQDVTTTDGQVNFIDDFAIVSQLEELSMSKEQQAEQAGLKYLAQLEQRVTKGTALEKHPIWQQYVSRFQTAAKKGYFSAENAYQTAPERPDKIDNFFSLLLLLEKEGFDTDRAGTLQVIRKLHQARGITQLSRLQYMLDHLK